MYPSLDEPLSVLKQMGRETVFKLTNLRAVADLAMVELDIPGELNRWGSPPCLSPAIEQPGTNLSSSSWFCVCKEHTEQGVEGSLEGNRLLTWKMTLKGCRYLHLRDKPCCYNRA
jgi:hypothetical protein